MLALPCPAAEDGQQATGASGAAGLQQQQGGQQQRLSDYVLPACDSKALCAYLDLFRCCSLLCGWGCHVAWLAG
jgi:hypothetical protein